MPQRVPRGAPHATPPPLRTCHQTVLRVGVRAGGAAAGACGWARCCAGTLHAALHAHTHATLMHSRTYFSHTRAHTRQGPTLRRMPGPLKRDSQGVCLLRLALSRFSSSAVTSTLSSWPYIWQSRCRAAAAAGASEAERGAVGFSFWVLYWFVKYVKFTSGSAYPERGAWLAPAHRPLALPQRQGDY